MTDVEDVLAWLRQLRANALAVQNPALAANCDKAIAVIVRLAA